MIMLNFKGRSLILPQNLLNLHNTLQPESAAPLLQVTMLTNNNGFIVALVTAYVLAATVLQNWGGVIAAVPTQVGA